MDVHSPPRRMTRARAAAKAGNPTASTATGATSASKAKAASSTTSTTSTSTATRTTTTTKRKTRPDESEEGDTPAMKAARPRGRPRKAVEEPPAEVRPVRRAAAASAAIGTATATRATRARRVTAETPVQEEEPARPKRGRPRKVVPAGEESNAPAEPVKTRARVTAAAATTRTAAKKTVTFEEPEKENINPETARGKAEVKPAVGLRGRPVRRTAAAAKPTTGTASTTTTTTAKATRATRTTRTAVKAPAKMPLSPKKASQVTARDMSEDELAGPEKTPLKKKPLRPPPSSTLAKDKAADMAAAVATAEGPASPAKDAAAAQEERGGSSNALASPAKRMPNTPFKDAIRSPAKRAEGLQLFGASPAKNAAQSNTATSPFKTSLLQSPAKRIQPGLMGMGATPSLARGEAVGSSTPMRSSLMQTPARRPGSVLRAFASARQEAAQSPLARATILATPAAAGQAAKASDLLMDGEEAEGASQAPRNLFAEPVPSLKFPGRLSAVLPRDANPALDLEMATVAEAGEDDCDLVGGVEIYQDPEVEEASLVHVYENEEPVGAKEEEEYDADGDGDHDMSDVLDISPAAAPSIEMNSPERTVQPISPAATTTPPNSPPKSLGNFGLRQKDLDPFHGLDDESEDELMSSFQRHYKSPSPSRRAAPPSTLPRRVSAAGPSGAGFTPLVAKFRGWAPASPVRRYEAAVQEATDESILANREAAAKQSFFDDEMTVREQNDVVEAAVVAAIEADIDAEMGAAFDDVDIDVTAEMDAAFHDVDVTAEDMDLTSEADELSLLGPDIAEDADMSQDYDDAISEATQNHDDTISDAGQDHDDTVSEASQDYGDENQLPPTEDPSVGVPPQTPARVIAKTFHTVSKVPLKAAGHPSPTPTRPRRHSISRLPVQMPGGGARRGATGNSHSPLKEGTPRSGPPATPAKESDAWSSAGTPARTPRRDLDAGLLRGAVVFVDVRTSDGGDASEFFAEVLAEMGARCVRRWDWSPGAGDSARVGITHVVYKDGGKRTLEKVREARGVVQCVGVSWVLECERQNEWVEEGPYHVNTDAIPHGRSRRRKTMEPKALANVDGTLVSSPGQQRSAPSTPVNRRASSVWTRTPPGQTADDDDDDDGELDWGHGVLTPLPATPATVAVARYVAGITPGGLSEDDDDEDDHDDDEGCGGRGRLMMTCPAKKVEGGIRGEIFSGERDGNVMMRLMAARRKSLQFAPKVGSPLAKAWAGEV